MLGLNMVSDIAERVVGEVETDTAGRLARGLIPGHVNVEVLWLCDTTLKSQDQFIFYIKCILKSKVIYI